LETPPVLSLAYGKINNISTKYTQKFNMKKDAVGERYK